MLKPHAHAHLLCLRALSASSPIALRLMVNPNPRASRPGHPGIGFMGSRSSWIIVTNAGASNAATP